MKDKIKFTKQKLSEGAAKATEAAANMASSFSEGLANSAELTKQKLSEGTTKATEAAANMTSSVSEGLANSAELTKQKLSEGTAKANEAAANMASSVSDGLANSAEFTKQKLGEGTAKATEAAANMTSSVSEGLANSAEFTKQKLSESAAKANEAAANMASSVSEGLANSAELTKQKLSEGTAKATEITAAAMNAILATSASISIDQWMRSVFSGPATVYDKALDLVYNTLKQHGADHRLFDGSHDIAGAWKAINQHVPEDAWITKAEGYVTALWKDVVTPKGLPIATWNKESFDKTADFLGQTLGISKGWTKDMVTFTGTELIGATIGTLAVILAWKNEDIGKFTDVVAGLGLSAVIGANPIMTIVAIIGLARCFQEARKNRENLKTVLIGGGKGLASTATMIAITSLVPAPAWITLILGIVGYVLIRNLYEKAELNSEELDQMLRNWFQNLNTVLSDVREKVNDLTESKLAEYLQQNIKSCVSETAKTIESAWSTGIQSTAALSYIHNLPPRLKNVYRTNVSE